jgi:hypothetical protein
MEEELYTLAEARKALNNMPATSFYRLVETGQIRKLIPPGKKQGMYPRSDIERLLSQSPQYIQTLAEKKEPEICVDWMTPKDLPFLLAFDTDAFEEEMIGSIPLYYSWWKKNPYTCLMAFEEGNRNKILAQVTMLPLDEDVIFSVLKGERKELSITADEIKSYDQGGEYTLLAENIITQPGHPEYVRPVLHQLTEFWCQEWPRIKVKKVFAETVSQGGLYLVQKMYFGPLYDIGEKAFVLDLRYKNPSRFIRSFQECIEKKEVTLIENN